ncbi:hypothetical protein Tco_0694568 [Tanacetum coccineum]
MAEQDIPPPTITAMKIPIIRKGEYDIWSMRKAPIYIPKSMGCYCHEIRRRIMHQQLEKLLLLLLLRLPNNWLQEGIRKELKASCVSNPDELTPRKNVLKHQFENFSTASNESLDKAYDRFPETEVQLEFMVFRFPTLLLRNLLFTPPLKILTVFKEVSDASGDFRFSTLVGIYQVPFYSNVLIYMLTPSIANQQPVLKLDNEDFQQDADGE